MLSRKVVSSVRERLFQQRPAKVSLCFSHQDTSPDPYFSTFPGAGVLLVISATGNTLDILFCHKTSFFLFFFGLKTKALTVHRLDPRSVFSLSNNIISCSSNSLWWHFILFLDIISVNHWRLESRQIEILFSAREGTGCVTSGSDWSPLCLDVQSVNWRYVSQAFWQYDSYGTFVVNKITTEWFERWQFTCKHAYNDYLWFLILVLRRWGCLLCLSSWSLHFSWLWRRQLARPWLCRVTW